MQQELFKFDVASEEEVQSYSDTFQGLRKINYNQIRIRPGFNARRQKGISDELYEFQLQIKELAEGIYQSNGPADPILGDISTDGIFYQTDGERRIRAIGYLIKTGRDTYPNGEPVEMVIVRLNPAGTTDLERQIKIVSTQDNLKLPTMDKAYHILRLKQQYNLTDPEIGKMLNMSRQSVNNYIKATTLPQSVQDDIDEGKEFLTGALINHRKEMAKKKNENADLQLVNRETGEVVEISPDEEYHRDEEECDEMGEVLTPEQKAKKREQETYRDGDEDEFLDKQDNSISKPGTRGGPKEQSGSATVGKDSIYVRQQREAAIKQFLHRYDHLQKIENEKYLRSEITAEEYMGAQDRIIPRLADEYDIKVR
jgi:hypothetical protein